MFFTRNPGNSGGPIAKWLFCGVPYSVKQYSDLRNPQDNASLYPGEAGILHHVFSHYGGQGAWKTTEAISG